MGERIKDPEFLDCLKRNKIREFSQGPELFEKELATARKDLKDAQDSFHYCLISAIKALYVEPGRLSYHLLEGLQKGKILRENADYYDDWSEAAAREMLLSAEGFLAAAEKMV